MDQEPDTLGERSGHRYLGGMQERYNVPAEFFGGPGGKRGIKIVGNGKQRAHDIIGLEPVGFDERAQQFVRGSEDLRRIVARDRRRSADPVEPD